MQSSNLALVQDGIAKNLYYNETNPNGTKLSEKK